MTASPDEDEPRPDGPKMRDFRAKLAYSAFTAFYNVGHSTPNLQASWRTSDPQVRAAWARVADKMLREIENECCFSAAEIIE